MRSRIFDPFRCDPPYCDLLGRMESYADGRSVSSTATDALKCEALGAEGRILFEPPRAGAPAPQRVHF